MEACAVKRTDFYILNSIRRLSVVDFGKASQPNQTSE
jgi:hypothetical protein